MPATFSGGARFEVQAGRRPKNGFAKSCCPSNRYHPRTTWARLPASQCLLSQRRSRYPQRITRHLDLFGLAEFTRKLFPPLLRPFPCRAIKTAPLSVVLLPAPLFISRPTPPKSAFFTTFRMYISRFMQIEQNLLRTNSELKTQCLF